MPRVPGIVLAWRRARKCVGKRTLAPGVTPEGYAPAMVYLPPELADAYVRCCQCSCLVLVDYSIECDIHSPGRLCDDCVTEDRWC